MLIDTRPVFTRGYRPDLPIYVRLNFSLLAFLLIACNGSEVAYRDPFAFHVPSNFPQGVYTFENNPVTGAGFELGHFLFYDPILSGDSTVSCANCHQQAVAFSDPVHRFSKGVRDQSGTRNAPAIQNVAFHHEFFWDGGVRHLDFVPINAITSTVEMEERLPNVIRKLRRSSRYPEMFSRAFHSDSITSQHLLFALSQFMTLMISSNAPYDKYVRSEGPALSSDELDGKALFESKCAPCHATDLFTDASFRNNGLDSSFENDAGRARITEDAGDIGRFKVPSLRNAAITSPYMHDGRFNTLKQVLEHYAYHVQYSATLDPLLNAEDRPGIHMNENEMNKIIAFIKTLTDKEFLSDKRFSNPFKP